MEKKRCLGIGPNQALPSVNSWIKRQYNNLELIHCTTYLTPNTESKDIINFLPHLICQARETKVTHRQAFFWACTTQKEMCESVLHSTSSISACENSLSHPVASKIFKLFFGEPCPKIELSKIDIFPVLNRALVIFYYHEIHSKSLSKMFEILKSGFRRLRVCKPTENLF